MLNADEPLGAVLWRLLYVSDIVDQDLAVVVAICSQSRPWNADVGITACWSSTARGSCNTSKGRLPASKSCMAAFGGIAVTTI